jgi:hypothetical protein
MTIAMDGTPVSGLISGAAANTVASAAFTNSLNDSIIFALVQISDGTSQFDVSAVSGGGYSLSAAPGGAIQGRTSNFDFGDLELWWVHAPTPVSAAAFTATLVSTPTSGDAAHSAAIIVFAVNGLNTSNPFDGNSSLPAVAKNLTATASAPAVSGISTNASSGLLLSSFVTPGNAASVPFTEPSGFTLIADSNGFSGTPNFLGGAIQGDREIFSSAQASVSVTYGTTVANWMMAVWGLQAPASASPKYSPLKSYLRR